MGRKAETNIDKINRAMLYADHYLITLNIREAHKAAGMSGGPSAYKYHEQDMVQRFIRERMQARNKRLAVDQDRVVLELERVALSNIGDVCEWKDGDIYMVNSSELTEDQSCAIQSFKIVSGENGKRIIPIMHNKSDALKLLYQHLGMGQEENQNSLVGGGLSGLLNYNPPGENHDGVSDETEII